ncbi:MAG: YwiC-like family protein [Acidimicrobiales bacterium]
MAIPAEHGGWGLTLEPVLLGLLVEPSASGALLGAAALVVLVARTPLKLALVDRRRGRHLDRTRLATRIAAAELALVLALVLGAWLLSEATFWGPLALAVPLVAVELWFDARSRGRRLVPELAGTVGIGSVAAAIVLAGGGDVATAAGVWLVVAARAVASVPFVRLQLARAKAQPHRRWACDLAQALAVALAIGGWAVGWLPPAAPIVVGLLAVVQVGLARTRPPRAALLGAQQVVLGLTVVVTTALGILAP